VSLASDEMVSNSNSDFNQAERQSSAGQ